jgi:preprotein translocase subunit SecG
MRKKILLIAVVFIVIILALSLLSSLHTHSIQAASRKASDTFLNDILNDKSSAAYALLTSQAQKDSPSDTWSQNVAQVSDFFLNEQPTYTGETITGTQKIYTYSITGLDGKYTFTVLVTQENAVWRVVSYASNLQ